MILVANGCSWTYGGGLRLDLFDSTRLNVTWPNRLGKLLDASKTVNLALNCGSNQRTVRTTFEWFNENYDPTETYLAIIQWTEFSRYEYYTTDNPFTDFENDPNKWVRVKSGVAVSKFIDYNDALTTANTRLKTYTEIEGIFNHLRDCASLAYLFNKLGIKYYFWHNANDNHIMLFKKYFDDFSYLDSTNWEYERVSKLDAHPSVQGHKEIANILQNLIDFK